MVNNVIYLNTVKQDKTQNVVNNFITDMSGYYSSMLDKYDINISNIDIAFDVATIQFLLRGMAHRSQGQNHPSQEILNALKLEMFKQ